ncbi:MAG: topoisomerase DNA-binding C4 zinc finger domain-containing protein [Oscillospiraceae bacterium]|nr:topoisomerase DNA-binding C4 zinc finger domain-containing protein [Oscillospiraceae bacterium]
MDIVTKYILYIIAGISIGALIVFIMYKYYMYYKRKTKISTYGKGIKRVKEDDNEEIPAKKAKEEITKSADTVENDLICPRCGSELVLRKARKGKDAGKNFYGCSRFPKCRYTRSLKIEER